MGTCKIEGCGRPRFGPEYLELCNSHVQKHYHNLRLSKECIHEDCNKGQYAKAYCRVHYERQRQGLPMDKIKEPTPECAAEGCDRPRKHRGTGLCHTHKWVYLDKGRELTPLRRYLNAKEVDSKPCSTCGVVIPLGQYYSSIIRTARGTEYRKYQSECKDCHYDRVKRNIAARQARAAGAENG